MSIEFDDLIPSKADGIEFDDLIPKGPSLSRQVADGVRALLGSVITPFNVAPKVQQLIDTVRPPEPTGSVFERVPVEQAPFNFARASAVRRAIDDMLANRRAREAQYGTIGPIVGPKPTVGSVASGLLSDLVAGAKGARAGVRQMAGDLTGSEHLLAQARRERGQADLMTAVNTPNFETDTARGIYGGLSSTVRQLPSIAAAVATRNPNIALGTMVAPMVPEEYVKFRQRGADPLPALAAAAGNAAAEYITEKLPMSFLVNQFGRAGAGEFLTGLLAREVPSEQVATLVQDAIDTAAANPDKTWGEYLAERPEAAYQTLLATLTQSAIMGGANAAANRLAGQQRPPEPTLADYQEAVRRVFGRAPAPATPAAPAPVPQAEVVNRILKAIEQTQNVQNVPPATGAEAKAPANEAPAPARSDAAQAARVPAEPAAPELEAAGLTFDDLVPPKGEAQTLQPAQQSEQAPQPVTQPAQPGATGEVAAASRPKPAAPILQNRNRATPSSIAQMQSIAAQPDYGRLGFSRDFANGAPVVAGGQVPAEQLGRQDWAVASDGRRIPVQYAVVEAFDVLPSNSADGTPNADYATAVDRIRAIAGNGRIAGLQLAYRNGTTADYLRELQGDTLHGVNPEVIRRMRAPVLVRVMPADQVTNDIGDVSNTVGNLSLSAVEQANNDAQRVNLDALSFAEDGGITPEAVRQFVRAMPLAEQGGLIDTNGQPTRQAVDRLNAAVFAKAYGNDQLIRLFAQAQDPEARNVLSALAQVAPKMARLEGAGALDIRDVVTQAAEIAVNARREGKALSLAARQMDMAADPDVGVVLQLFADNARTVRPVVEALGRMADMAYTEANKPAEDMFGAVPRASRTDVINQLRPENERTSPQALENPAGGQRVEQVDEGPAPEPARAATPAEDQADAAGQAEGLTPWVKVNGKITVSKNGRLHESSMVRWDSRWKKQAEAVREDGEAYNAEAHRRRYTDDRQLQLFLDNGPDPSQAGPRGEAAQRQAVSAVDDIRSTETLLGLALSRDYAARQRASLVGQKVSSAEDLAVLAQVYRDPRFETFRVVFVNDAGRVVSQVGLTSRLPASAVAIMGNDVDAYLRDLSATARSRGATGFYLLHNHPSGIATPSRADIVLTTTFAQRMPMLEFKSHVVIDTNEYATIDRHGTAQQHKRDFGQPAPYRAPEWANVSISGPADVMAMAKRLQVDNGAITLIHTDNQYRVKAISTIPASVGALGKQELRKQILKASLQTHGAQVFAVGRDVQVLRQIGEMVVDAIHVEDVSGKVSSLRSIGMIPGGTPFPESRRPRVSPDSSPEFNYLRRTPQTAALQRVAEPGIDQAETREFRRRFGDKRQGELDELTGLPLNPDGTVTVYHHTSADKAEAIRKTGQLKSAAEPHVYVTTRREADTGYGDTAVPIRVNPELLQIGDEFPDGRIDYRIDVGRPGGSVKVLVGEYQNAAQPVGELPDTIEVDGEQRPTRNSKGQLIHPTEEGIRNFWRWFGDSRVVDEQGRPLVVYHGTALYPWEQRTQFDPGARGRFTREDRGAREGFFFAESAADASFYADRAESRSDERPHPDDQYERVKAEGVVLDVYLRANNPLVIDLENSAGLPQADYDNIKNNNYEALRYAQNKGHDAVLIADGDDVNTPGTWVVFRPEQIKSATGNRGTFDPNDPSIVREDGPEYGAQLTSPNRDALGRFKFRLGEVALHKLDAATRPLQERFGMRMASPELRKQLRQMKATIEEAKRKAVDVAKEMSAMSEADRIMVSDIVEKMLAPGVIPPEHAVRVADAITKTMDQQTDELVALGMLSAESAERWRGRYLPRFYNRQTELGDDPLIKRLFKTGAPTAAGIGGGSLKGRGLFQDVSIDSVDQWLALGYEVRDPHWKLVQGKLELKDPNAPKVAREKVTVWRDWTPSERAQMGEIRDAMYRFVMGYTAMQRDIALGRLFNNIANNPEWVRRSGSEGWVQVPDTEIPGTGGVKRYGNLAGLWVRKDVMSHLTQFEEAANDTMQLYREALGLWKEGKTALNPVAHFNNILSNLSMAHFAGVSYWDVHKYAAAAKDLIDGAPMVDEARKAGLLTGSFTKEEMVQHLPPELQKLANMEEGRARRAGRLLMDAMTFWLRQPLRDAYEFEDSFFKYLIYRDARQQGLNPEDATDYALRYIFTYDDLPSGARKVRDYLIPFFSWTYKAVPVLLHTAMVYPWRFLAPAAVLHGINAVAYALAAGDEGDDWLEKLAKGRELEKEEREALPDRTAGYGLLLNPKTIRLGTDSLTGNPVFLDVSRVVPGGDMFDSVNQAGGLPLPAPVMPNHPVLSVFSAMIANREMFFGGDIVDKNDTSIEAAEKRAKWMAGFLLPAIAPGGYHSQRILDAAAAAADTVITTPLGDFTGVGRDGLPVQPKYAAMQTVGIKARPFDLELEAQRKKAQEAALINSIAAEVRSMARLHQRGAVSDRMMDEAREKAREKIDRIRQGERP